jgi:hypothetical protein
VSIPGKEVFLLHHLLHSGQTRCFDSSGKEIPCRGSGHDGELQLGMPWPKPRFAVKEAIVRDRLTGLTWTLDANIDTFPCTWDEAFHRIGALNREHYGGCNDWRLPNRNELRSLISYQAKNPALPDGHPFHNVFLGWYWTSTSAAINPAYAWAIHMEGARMFYGRKDQGYLFWPVCGAGNGNLPATGQQHCFDMHGKVMDCPGTGQDGALQRGVPWPLPRFSEQSECIHDRLTGLLWPRHADLTGNLVSWQQAFESVVQWRADTGKKEKILWRLPTINELASLVDCSAHSPALPNGHPFTGTQPAYWSSTTSYFETDWAWVLYLDKGACGVGYKPGKTFSVWPVGITHEN